MDRDRHDEHDEHDEHDDGLLAHAGDSVTTNDSAHTASREAAERARATGESAPIAPEGERVAAGDVAGAAGGAAAAATVGTLILGPIGTVIGAISGALGGWWLGHEAEEVQTGYTPEEDAHYRTIYEARDDHPADAAYERARPGYVLGHMARRNPEYVDRSFEQIEPQLQRAWETGDWMGRYAPWSGMRGYVRQAYELREPRPLTPNEVRDRVSELQDPLPPGPDERS